MSVGEDASLASGKEHKEERRVRKLRALGKGSKLGTLVRWACSFVTSSASSFVAASVACEACLFCDIWPACSGTRSSYWNSGIITINLTLIDLCSFDYLHFRFCNTGYLGDLLSCRTVGIRSS